MKSWNRKLFGWCLLLSLAWALAGCGTTNSYASGCPSYYSGVRTDVEYLRSFDSWKDGWDWLVVAGDVPLSAVVDTAGLPLAAVFDAAPATPVSPGCLWNGGSLGYIGRY